MAITAAQVNELRKKTGVAMMKCKKALTEAGGDMEKAVEILKIEMGKKLQEKSDRSTGEGAIQVAMSEGKVAACSLFCETDFVARNEEFIALSKKIAEKAVETDAETAKADGEEDVKAIFTKLGENIQLGGVEVLEGETVGAYVHSNNKLAAIVVLSGGNSEMATDVAMHITAMSPKVISPDEVSDELLAKEKTVWIEQLKEEGKPENIVENILIGKEKKFREEAALIKQTFVKNPELTIEKFLGDASVKSFKRIAI